MYCTGDTSKKLKVGNQSPNTESNVVAPQEEREVVPATVGDFATAVAIAMAPRSQTQASQSALAFSPLQVPKKRSKFEEREPPSQLGPKGHQASVL